MCRPAVPTSFEIVQDAVAVSLLLVAMDAAPHQHTNVATSACRVRVLWVPPSLPPSLSLSPSRGGVVLLVSQLAAQLVAAPLGLAKHQHLQGHRHTHTHTSS